MRKQSRICQLAILVAFAGFLAAPAAASNKSDSSLKETLAKVMESINIHAIIHEPDEGGSSSWQYKMVPSDGCVVQIEQKHAFRNTGENEPSFTSDQRFDLDLSHLDSKGVRVSGEEAFVVHLKTKGSSPGIPNFWKHESGDFEAQKPIKQVAVIFPDKSTAIRVAQSFQHAISLCTGIER